MIRYSISDIERLSGIKAHTLRIWEKRYGILKPQRTDNNIRYYLDDDLRLAMNIATLNRNGYKISKIANLTKEQIAEKVIEITQLDQVVDKQMDVLMMAMMELDNYTFEKIIDHHIEKKGFYDTMIHLVYPFIDKMRIMWMTDSIGEIHEKFVSSLVKRKLISAIDNCETPTRSKGKFLVFSQGESAQELALLFQEYLLKCKGFQLINFGNQIDCKSLTPCGKMSNLIAILTVLDQKWTASEAREYITKIQQKIPNKQILVTTINKDFFDPSDESLVKTFDSLTAFESFVDQEL